MVGIARHGSVLFKVHLYSLFLSEILIDGKLLLQTRSDLENKEFQKLIGAVY